MKKNVLVGTLDMVLRMVSMNFWILMAFGVLLPYNQIDQGERCEMRCQKTWDREIFWYLRTVCILWVWETLGRTWILLGTCNFYLPGPWGTQPNVIYFLFTKFDKMTLHSGSRKSHMNMLSFILLTWLGIRNFMWNNSLLLGVWPPQGTQQGVI